MRFLAVLAFIAVVGLLLWHFKVLQDIGGAFDGWLRFIGAR
jgi:hypothetical protein